MPGQLALSTGRARTAPRPAPLIIGKLSELEKSTAKHFSSPQHFKGHSFPLSPLKATWVSREPMPAEWIIEPRKLHPLGPAKADTEGAPMSNRGNFKPSAANLCRPLNFSQQARPRSLTSASNAEASEPRPTVAPPPQARTHLESQEHARTRYARAAPQESRSQLESDAGDGVVGGLRTGRVNGLVKWDWPAVEACPLGVKVQKGIDVLLGCAQK
ncbi:hypothetical protein ACRRTK_007843 [Alexandromys fortis]